MTPKKITCSNRTVWEAFDAIAVLASERWPQTSIAIAIGRTFRRLREKRDEIDKDRTVLLDQFAIKQEDDSYTKDVGRAGEHDDQSRSGGQPRGLAPS